MSNNAGILVAFNQRIEWLLPWWWERYSACNTLPVAFVDLGMSPSAKQFCIENGTYLPLETTSIAFAPPDEVWKNHFCSRLEENRKSWIYKPSALLKTPFKRTLWLDLDCEVLQPLDPLFNMEKGFYLAKETEEAKAKEISLGILKEEEILYNTGVILYDQNDPLIKKWKERCFAQGQHFISDQHVLSRLIYEEKWPIKKLHEIYNWRITHGLHFNMAIVHWAGDWGKKYIRLYGGIGCEFSPP